MTGPSIVVAETHDSPRLRRLLLAARLFLEANFEERRSAADHAAHRPPSTGNCWAAARFLRSVLAAARVRGPGEGRWAAAWGLAYDACGDDFPHAFAAWVAPPRHHTALVADLTGDQFDHAAVFLGSPAACEYRIREIIDDHPQGRETAGRWYTQWRSERDFWLAAAESRTVAAPDASPTAPGPGPTR